MRTVYSRLWLGILSIPLAILLFEMAVATKPGGTPWFFDIANQRILRHIKGNPFDGIGDYEAVSLANGSIQRVHFDQDPRGRIPPPQSDRIDTWFQPVDHPEDQQLSKTWMVKTIQGKKTIGSRRIEFPAYPQWFAQRYALGMDTTHIYCLDLSKPDSQLQTYTCQFPFQSLSRGDDLLQLIEHNGQTFYRINNRAWQAVLELFKVNEQGQIEMIASWPVLPSPSGGLVSVWQDRFYSVDPKNFTLEMHARSDGQFLGLINLERTVDFSKDEWSLRGPWLEVRSSLLNEGFELPSGKLHRTPIAKDRRVGKVHGAEDLMWSLDAMRPFGQVVIWKQNDNEVVAELDTEADCCDVAITDKDQVLVASRAFGLSIFTFDLHTRKKLNAVYPYWWVIPLSIFTVLYFVVWSVLWFLVSTRAGGWASMDIAIVFGMVISTMAVRHSMRFGLSVQAAPGWTNSIDTFDYLFWLCHGALQLSVCWIVFGSSRILLRVLPMVLVIGFMIFCYRTISLSRESASVWFMSACAVLSSAMMFALLSIVKLLGWRLKTSDEQSQSERKGFSWSLSDLFLAVALFAVLAAALQPYLPPVDVSFRLRNSVEIGMWACVSSTTGLILAYSNKQRLFVIACGLALLGASIVVSVPIAKFCYDKQWFHWLTLPRIIALAGVVPFFIALPYRFRGWRLIR